MTADLTLMDPFESAWAAGLFDGDGSIACYVPKRRHTSVIQLTVYQHETAPLERFRRAMGDAGAIHGPYRDRLYHWTTKRLDAVEAVARALSPSLTEPTRATLASALATHPRLRRVRTDLAGLPDPSVELAWAAGLFDAEGWVSESGAATPRLELPQSTRDGEVPPILHRFHGAVRRAGRIEGPRPPVGWSKLPQYRWVASSRADVQAVAAFLWKWLGPAKREPLRDGLARKPRRPRPR